MDYLISILLAIDTMYVFYVLVSIFVGVALDKKLYRYGRIREYESNNIPYSVIGIVVGITAFHFPDDTLFSYILIIPVLYLLFCVYNILKLFLSSDEYFWGL